MLDDLGRAIAKVHCVSGVDSEQDLVPFQTERAIVAITDGRRAEFAGRLADFGMRYAEVVRDDHRLFVDAFRHGEIPGRQRHHRA